MAVLGPIFWVVILLGIMILIHELGHLWAALAVGIKVETFSLGFGPRLFGFSRHGTDYRISAVPFGGYVRMLGELPGDEAAADPRSFESKKRWQRAIVIVAGPLMNVLLAVAVGVGLYMHGFPEETPSSEAIISSVIPGSPAAKAGLQPGDKIVALDGKRNPSWEDVLTQEALSANHALHVTVDRKGKQLSFLVTPKMDPREGIGVAGWRGDIEVGEVTAGSPAAAAGLQPGDALIEVNGTPIESAESVRQAIIRSKGKPVELEIERHDQLRTVTVTPVPGNTPGLPWHIGIAFRMPLKMVSLGFGQAVAQSLRWNRENATMIFRVLGSIVERRVSPKTLAGPIGIAQLSNEAAQAGAATYLGLMSVVSLNLAIFNLLPIPLLDGGRLLLLIIEMLLQREVSMQVKETIFKLGFVFLMMIVVFVIYNDISRILTKS